MLTIRLAVPGDGQRLETFLEANNEHPDPAESYIGVAQVIDKPPRGNFFMLMAVENGEIVGALAAGGPAKLINANELILTEGAKAAVTQYITEISWVIVNSAHRRKGIGKKLLAEAEKHIRKTGGLAILFFEPSTPGLRKFYEDSRYIVIQHGHGIAVQPPSALAPPIGLIPTYQAAYKTLKPHVYVRLAPNGHIIHGAFDR